MVFITQRENFSAPPCILVKIETPSVKRPNLCIRGKPAIYTFWKDKSVYMHLKVSYYRLNTHSEITINGVKVIRSAKAQVL